MAKQSSFPIIPSAEPEQLPFTEKIPRLQKTALEIDIYQLGQLKMISTMTGSSLTELINDAITQYNNANFAKHVPSDITKHFVTA